MSFGENSIKIDLNQIQASRKQFHKEKSVPSRKKCLKGHSIGVWRLYVASKMTNFQKTTTCFPKKTLCTHSSHAKMIVQKRILLCIFREKLWIFKKSIHRLAKLASLLKRGQRGHFYPWGAFFPLFYTKRSVLGSKIGGFLMILMSISSCKLMLHVILVFPKFINSIFTPAQEF